MYIKEENNTNENNVDKVYNKKGQKIINIERGRENKTQSSCMLVETESIQVLNKAEGGPGMPAELSLDISCQHFITVAVIKRWRPRRWPRAAKLHLDWIGKPPTATAAAAQWLQQELMLICTHFNQLAKKSQTSHHIYVMVFSDRHHTSGKLPDALLVNLSKDKCKYVFFFFFQMSSHN